MGILPMRSLLRFIPDSLRTPHKLGEHRFFGRWAHLLQHPRLWVLNRRGVALGAAVGVFFAFLAPVAQIPVAVAAAIALRAHIPAAALGTLVTNPVTFAPFYFLAFHIGESVRHALGMGDAMAAVPGAPKIVLSLEGLAGAAGDIAVGMAVMGVAGSALAYLAVLQGWRLRVLFALRRRAKRRRKKA